MAVVFIGPETLRIAKGVMPSFSFKTREIRTLGKEVFVGPIKIFQRLLQNLRMGFSRKSVSFSFFQSRRASQSRETLTLPS